MLRDERWPPASAPAPLLFGGEGPPLHLAHANGFPPATYRRLADLLAVRHRVFSLPQRPLWPGSRPDSVPSWRTLAGDLVQGLDAMGLSGIVGVGHSIGGVLTLWAAVGRPDLFRAAVLVDPVLLPPGWLWLLRLMGLARLERRAPLVQGALRRRRRWPSEQECFDQLRRKPLFALWPDAALWDYVMGGTRRDEDGSVELLYPPEWEAHIFATSPTDVWRDVPRLTIPCLVIRGEQSTTFPRSCLERVGRLLPQARLVTVAGASHLVPLERPEETAAAIGALLDGP